MKVGRKGGREMKGKGVRKERKGKRRRNKGRKKRNEVIRSLFKAI